MKLVYGTKPLVLHGEDGEVFTLRYSNRGEPYREGAEISAHLEDHRNEVGVFLATEELRQLRDKLNELMPTKARESELLDLLKAAARRVELANAEGDMILSAWLADAQGAIAKAEGRDA